MPAVKRERIKDQMVNTAARLWGLEESDIETNFDPLIQLLIEACAAELEKISHNITESHTRLLDYLAEIILPESLFGTMPATGIMQAFPLEADTEVNINSDFYLSQNIQRQSTGNMETVEFHLSPIGTFNLLKADIGYMIAGNKLFRIKENGGKELLFAPDKLSHSNELWLAISHDKKLHSLKGLSVYIDMPNHSGANSFYNSLTYAKAWLNDTALDMVSGFDTSKSIAFDQQEILMKGDDRTSKINRQAAFVHQKRFLTFKDSPKISSTVLPDALKEKFPAEVIAQLQAENLSFIRIQLPQYFSQEVFDVVNCHVNAFPVVNKKINHFNYRTDDWLNIIAIPGEDTFFDLEAVKSEKNEAYKIRSSAGLDGITAGEVIVRSGGVGRTSSPEVREMINNISETIRDQSAYFGQTSNEFILGRLREIGKILAGLEDNITAATDKKPEFNYLMLRPRKNGEMVSISYWTTNGDDANSIRAGASLSAFNNTLLNPKKSHTLTSFTGGKDVVNESEKKTILRQQLISGGKIISAEDVKLLCLQLYGSKLKKVEVRKGVQVSNKADEGFKRTIDVLLTYSQPATEAQKPEMDNLYRELEYILESNASPVYPFRIVETNAG